MRNAVLLSLSILLALGTDPGNASPNDAGDLDTVVVTATRTPTPESEVASSITVVTAEDIAAMQTPTLPDLLKQVPGLNVVQNGGPGGATSVFLRGTNSNHVKVFVDGVDVGDPSSSTASFDFGHFLTQDIQTVEVLRGPQSGLYGSDAIGGVINVITKDGSGPLELTAAAEGGSFGTFNQTAGVSGSTDRVHYTANIEHFHAGETPVTPLDLLLPGERRIDDYYDNLTGSTKLRFDLTDTLDVGLVARYTDTHLRFTGENENAYPNDFPDSAQSTGNTTQYYARLAVHNLAFDGVLDHTLGIAYSNIKSTDNDPEMGPSENAGNRFKLDWQGNIRLADQQTLIVGAEHQREAISQPIAADTLTDSGYAELQSGFGTSFFDTVSVRYDDNDRFGRKVTYRVAPTYLINDTGTKLKASAGTGFKAPTLSELFQSFPGFTANPNLKPESSLGYDVGFEQALLADALQVGATYFHNNIRNLIDGNADETSYANVGRATTEGVESFVAYQPTSSYTVRLDHTYTQATDDVLHLTLLRRPKNKASLRNSWRATSRLSLDASILYLSSWVDGNRDFSIARLNAPAFTTVNFAASFDLTHQCVLYGRIDNLLNRHYQDPIGFLQPTLGAYAGIKVKF